MQRLSALLVLLVFPASKTLVNAGSAREASERLDHEIGSHLRHGSHVDRESKDQTAQVRRRDNRSEAETQADADHPAAVSHGARADHRESRTADDDSGSLRSFAAAVGTALGRHGREEGTHASSNASKPLPEHGFHGRLVAHKDGETYTKDWQSEYGPHAKRIASYDEICAKYPRNEWCRTFHPSAYSASSSGADAPGADAPGADAPGADAPGADAPGADAPGAYAPGVDASSAGGPSWGDFWPDQLGGSDEGKQGKHESHGGMSESGTRAARLVGLLGAAAALL